MWIEGKSKKGLTSERLDGSVGSGDYLYYLFIGGGFNKINWASSNV